MKTQESRRGRLVVAAVTISAFGPYITGGFRTEQIAVYAAFAALIVGLAWRPVRPSGIGITVILLLAVQLAVAVIGALAPPLNTTAFAGGSPLAGADNFALPLAAVGIVWMLVARGADRQMLLRRVSWLTVWAMVANSGLAVAAAAGSDLDLDIFQSPGAAESVAAKAETMGRYSGIFNQPAEAGLVYSIALIAAVYLYRQRALLLATTAMVLSVGGIITVSKIFLLVGLPVGIWQILATSGGRQRRVAAVASFLVAFWAATKAGMIPAWEGQDFLLRLLPGSDDNAVDLYTAGRFGDDSTLAGLTDMIMRASPAWGFGAGGLLAPYDNGWVEALATAGLVGALVQTAVLVALAVGMWTNRRILDAPEARLGIGLVIIVIGANTGVPALTANRAATIVWLFAGLLLASTGSLPELPASHVPAGPAWWGLGLRNAAPRPRLGGHALPGRHSAPAPARSLR